MVLNVLSFVYIDRELISPASISITSDAVLKMGI